MVTQGTEEPLIKIDASGFVTRIDTSGIVRAFEQMREAMQALPLVMANLARSWRGQPLYSRDRWLLDRAGRNWDPITGAWQSDLCAAWLHGSCPNPAATDCRCTCHGGPLR